jgi:hypothetical protein
VLPHEAAGSGQRGLAFVQGGGVCLEYVGYAGYDVQGDRDVIVGGPGGLSYRVVEENLMRAGLDQQRRQTRQAAVDRADRGIGCAGASR